MAKQSKHPSTKDLQWKVCFDRFVSDNVFIFFRQPALDQKVRWTKKMLYSICFVLTVNLKNQCQNMEGGQGKMIAWNFYRCILAKLGGVKKLSDISWNQQWTMENVRKKPKVQIP